MPSQPVDASHPGLFFVPIGAERSEKVEDVGAQLRRVRSNLLSGSVELGNIVLGLFSPVAISILGATHGNHRWQAGKEKVTC
jgi:hypothetical protein